MKRYWGLEESKVSELDTSKTTHSNSDTLCDSFYQPLTNIITNEEYMIGINKKGELKGFEYTQEIRNIEIELSKYAKDWNSELLDLKLLQYYEKYGEELNDTLKYILSFYKVLI